MKVTTLISLPDEVYQFYTKTANLLADRTTEQVIADTLIDFANQASEHSYPQISSTSKSL